MLISSGRPTASLSVWGTAAKPRAHGAAFYAALLMLADGVATGIAVGIAVASPSFNELGDEGTTFAVWFLVTMVIYIAIGLGMLAGNRLFFYAALGWLIVDTVQVVYFIYISPPVTLPAALEWINATPAFFFSLQIVIAVLAGYALAEAKGQKRVG